MTHNNNDDNKKPDYEVGYGKPPKEKQFPPGKSGNPKGRPKGSKNFSTLIEAGLKSIIPITDQGVRKKVSKKEAFAMQIINKGLAGDQRFIPILVEEIRKQEARRDNAESKVPPPAVTPDITDEELERIYKETLKNASPTK